MTTYQKPQVEPIQVSKSGIGLTQESVAIIDIDADVSFTREGGHLAQADIKLPHHWDLANFNTMTTVVVLRADIDDGATILNDVPLVLKYRGNDLLIAYVIDSGVRYDIVENGADPTGVRKVGQFIQVYKITDGMKADIGNGVQVLTVDNEFKTCFEVKDGRRMVATKRGGCGV